MNVTELVKKPNFLKVLLEWPNETSTFTSPEFVINGVVQFSVRIIIATQSGRISIVHVRFTKRRPADDRTYMIYLNSEKLDIKGKTFTSDDGTWYMIFDKQGCYRALDVTVELHIVPSASPFASLHDDTELTDFELRGEDGAVRVHRAVLAAASPVLRRMLAGAWREASEGHVHVSGTSRATLEHLKDYLYLRKLPESGLEQLLLLSSYYIMPELEQCCIDKVLQGATTAENLRDLIEFAIKNNVKNLIVSIFEYAQYGAYGAIDAIEMRDHFKEDVPPTDENK